MAGEPTLRATPRNLPVAALLGGAGALLAIGFLALRLGYANTIAYYGSLAGGAAAIGYLLWRANPAVPLTLAIVLTPMAGRWTELGLPGGYVAPDRFLVVGALGAIALRGPW